MKQRGAKNKYLLTGASGFIGMRIYRELNARGECCVVAAVRKKDHSYSSDWHSVGDINGETDWSQQLHDCRVVIHAAAKAHIMRRLPGDSLESYKIVNTDATLNLARQAVTAGVKRFIFISSIGVNGYINNRPFTTGHKPSPADPYAQSKWEAEKGLWEISKNTGMEVVIIRPPLVYGPNAPGNFGRLVRWVKGGIPLPFGAVHNKRTLVAIDNLVDLIVTCIHHPNAANQLFLAGDGRDLSTTELLQGMARAMGKPSRLLPVPARLLRMGATLVGKKRVAQQLLGSLQVDIGKTCELLAWKPPITVEEGLKRCFETETKE